MLRHEWATKLAGRFIPVDDPELVLFREQRKEMWKKLEAFSDDPKYKKLVAEITECGFGDLYELFPFNFIKDETNAEYVFIDYEPAIDERSVVPGSIFRFWIPKRIRQSRISFELVQKTIDAKLTGEAHTPAINYLNKLRELLPKNIHQPL